MFEISLWHIQSLFFLYLFKVVGEYGCCFIINEVKGQDFAYLYHSEIKLNYFAAFDLRKNPNLLQQVAQFPSCDSMFRDPKLGLFDQISLKKISNPRVIYFVNYMEDCFQNTHLS